MKTIWKFKLEICDEQHLVLPAEAEILTAQIQTYKSEGPQETVVVGRGKRALVSGLPQKETLYLWAFVDTDEKRVKTRIIEIYGTGNPINADDFWITHKYISTFQMLDGHFVGHVFECKR